jgi:hypothetical protein
LGANYLLAIDLKPQIAGKSFCDSAILIIKIGLLKARLRRAFNKPILVFLALAALETPKSVS